MRRRLSPLAKAVFHTVSHCLAPNEQIPIIFSSVNGEIQRTFNQLGDMCAGNGVSPTSFSLSVHNAIAGQLSIALNNQAPMLAIAPTAQGALPALLEAAGWLHDNPANDIVVVLFDEPLPTLIEHFDRRQIATESLALRLSRQSPCRESITREDCSPTDMRTDTCSPASIADIAQFLQTQTAEPLTLCQTTARWQWSRHRA
jgi:hypothetical protein